MQASNLTKDILQEVKKNYDGKPHFLKTRILAELRERRSAKKTLIFWKYLNFVTASVSITVICLFLIFNPSSQTYLALTGKPVALKIELEDFDTHKSYFARIRLPKELKFYSRLDSQKDISQLKYLDINFSMLQKPNLSIVLRSDQEGEFEVEVEIYNEKEDLVRSKTMKIKFTKEKVKS